MSIIEVDDSVGRGLRVAVCSYCNREMRCRVSCRADPILVAGEAYEPRPWGKETFDV